MSMSTESITTWPSYIPYIALGVYSTFAVSIGSIVALSGRRADSARRLLIGRIALAFWGVAIATLFKAPLWGYLVGPAGLLFASYVSGRYKRFLVPVIVAGIAGLVALVVIAAFPLIDLFALGGLIVFAIAVTIGYRLGEKYRDFVKIATTAYSGAGLIASGVLGFLFIYDQKPWLFAVDVALNSLLPLLGPFIDNATFVETLVQLLVFGVVFCVGARNQYTQYIQGTLEPNLRPHT